MLIAIPSDAPGGLDASISEHFGHCAFFTVVEIDDKKIGEVQVHENSGHAQGGCMAPVMILKQLGVEALVAGGMGARPLAGFQQVGISVHFKGDAGTVGDAVQLFVDGKCREFGQSQTCGGGGGHCGGHHHEVVREPIEGKADVQDGRVVTMDFELKDKDGTVLDSSVQDGPMQYLQGSGVIVGLEKGIAGLEAGDNVTVEIKPEEGFGERDEEQVMEVSRDQLPPSIEVGTMLTAESPDGHQIPLVVLELKEKTAILDANHPLAGKTIIFDVTIKKVEQATPEEIEHGHAH